MNNANEVLRNTINCISELERCKSSWEHPGRIVCRFSSKRFITRAVCEELEIFDWWRDELSMSQLKQMKRFLESAIRLGFDGYVCFKVGAAGCSNGMWAHKEKSTDGFSPDGDVLYRSFSSSKNYYDIMIGDKWMSEEYPEREFDSFGLKDVKAFLNEKRR